MGAISTITVADATPTNHDFVPTAVGTDGVARWNERSATTPVGFWPLAVSLRAPVPGASSKMYKVVLTVAIPTLVSETINGVVRSTLEYTNRAEVTFLMSASSVLADRQHLNAVVRNLLNHASIKDVVESLNTVY